MSQEIIKPTIEVPKPWLYKVVRLATDRYLLKDIELTSNGIENVPYEGGVSAEANHRNDDIDVLAAGLVLSERRAAFYPAKAELDTFPRGWVLKNCGALFFVRGDRAEARRISELSSSHIERGHLVLTFIEGTSKNEGQLVGRTNQSADELNDTQRVRTFNSATRNAIDNNLDEIILVGIGGTDTPFRTDEEGLKKKKREKPEKVHVEIGKVSIFDAVNEYRQAEIAVPKPIQKAIHNDVVVPALQTVVDIAYSSAV